MGCVSLGRGTLISWYRGSEPALQWCRASVPFLSSSSSSLGLQVSDAVLKERLSKELAQKEGAVLEGGLPTELMEAMEVGDLEETDEELASLTRQMTMSTSAPAPSTPAASRFLLLFPRGLPLGSAHRWCSMNSIPFSFSCSAGGGGPGLPPQRRAAAETPQWCHAGRPPAP